MIAAFIGSVLGTIALQLINAKMLTYVIPIALLFIAIYFLISPMPKERRHEPQLSEKKYCYLIVPCIGFYDGMFGPGTGSFFALTGVSCRGRGLIDATAVAKPLNFSTNIASLIVFISAGQVVWLVGLIMMLGQMLGAWIGAHYLFKINPAYLRLLVVVMCLAMLLKYCYSMGWINF